MDYTKVDVVDHYSGQEDDLQKFDIVYDSATNSGGGEDYREKSLSLLKRDESNHGKIQLHGCSLFSQEAIDVIFRHTTPLTAKRGNILETIHTKFGDSFFYCGIARRENM